jgi:hypothetical protein
MEKTEGARLTWADAKVWTARVQDGPFELGFLLSPEGDKWRLSVFESIADSPQPKQFSVLRRSKFGAQNLAQRLVDGWSVEWSWERMKMEAHELDAAAAQVGLEDPEVLQ